MADPSAPCVDAASPPVAFGKFSFLLNDKLLADTQLNLRRLQSRPPADEPWLVASATAGATGTTGSSDSDASTQQAVRAGAEGVASAEEEEEEQSETPAIAPDATLLESFTVHAPVLCANSPYFRAKLLGPFLQGPSPSQSSSSSSSAAHAHPHASSGSAPGASPEGPQLRLLEEMLMPADVPAMKSVLRFMYTEVLDYKHGVHSPASLMTILRIADRFKVTDCVSACRREFSKLRVSDIDLEVLRMVFSIDTIVSDPSSFTEMMSAVQERLLELFKEVVTVIRSPALLSQFLTLPFAAVAALLRSDRLVTDSENSVVVLASLWMVRSPQGQRASAEQRRYLASCIRLSLLTPSYLCGVLPNLKWFSFPASSPAAYFQAVQMRLISSSESRTLLQAQGQKLQPSLATHLPRTFLKDQNLELFLEIEERSLAEYLKAGHEQLLTFGPPSGGSSPGTAGAAAGSAATQLATGSGSRGVQVNSETTFFCGFLFGIKLVFGHSVPAPAAAPQQVQGGAQSPTGGSTAAPAPATPPTAGGGGGMLRSFSSSKVASGQGTAVAAAAAAAAAGEAAAAAAAAAGESRFAVTPSVFASIPPGEEALLPLSSPINVCFRCSLEALGPYGTPFAAATFTGGSFMKPGEEAESSVAVSNFFRKVGASLHEVAAWQPFLSDGKLKLKLTLQGPTLE